VEAFMGPTDNITNGPHGAICKFYVDPLFCDSTVTTNFGSGATHVQSLKMGGMFDPKSTLYPAANVLPNWEAYTVDTVWIAGAYHIKTTSANAHDTLQVELSWGYDTTNFFSALTVASPAQKWRMPMNVTSVAAGNKCFSTGRAAQSVKLKHVLTVADTVTVGTAGANWPYIPIKLPTPMAVPAGGIVSVQYTYINKSAVPANKVYFVSPTNTSTMNSYLAYEAADSSGVTHNYFYDSTSYGSSGVVDIMSRYGKFPTAQAFLNGVMLPQTEYGYVWDLSIGHTPLITSAPELQSQGLALFQNIPNPFSGISEIGYELGSSSAVVFSIYDLTGRVVMERNFGIMDSGRHSISVDAAEFKTGIYFYSLKASGVALSKKMIITE
ncbi:MAG TPA: T9SS type A sorting domain-containing protein, partial [Bacteroidia bacterium]|nr:T9SS type A sorting domain-containing protein [Bacteroidia bacterium]